MCLSCIDPIFKIIYFCVQEIHHQFVFGFVQIFEREHI